MKKNALIAFCGIFLFSFSIMAQETKKPQEPEFTGVVYFLDLATGKLIDLERQLPVAKTKVKAFGYGGMNISMEMDGERSPVRFKPEQKLSFIVRVADPREDPNGTFGISSYESKKGKRIKGIVKIKPLGLGTSTPTATQMLDVRFSKYGESSMKMEILSQFVPGEYCIGHVTSKANFCFGIDSAVETK